MEGRMNKYRQVSPERAKVWTEKSPKYRYIHHSNQQQQYHDARKVPVVYYLCRNQQLAHPHFMEVPISSSDDHLYLRDVIERLNVLRGRGIASMYAWSCKRSYKNAYVWHDLCDDDVIYPAHGNDYILKGTELFEESNSGRFNPAGTSITQNQKALPEPSSFRNKEGSTSPSSPNGRATKGSQDDELSPLLQRPLSSAMSPEFVQKKSSFNGSLNLTEYNIGDGLASTSSLTKAKDNRVVGRRSMCTRGVSTDDGLSEPNEIQVSQDKDEGSVAAAPPLCRGIDTLESLVRADIRRIVEKEGCRIPSRPKLKVANTIMQLVSCGSISVKDHKFPLMLGEVNSSCLMGMRLKDKQPFCGSIAETSPPKEDVPTLRQSSYNADSSRGDKENVIKVEES